MLQYTLLGMGEPCEIDSVSTEGISSGDATTRCDPLCTLQCIIPSFVCVDLTFPND